MAEPAEDPDISLADTFDDPNHNPFAEGNNNEPAAADTGSNSDAQSVASQRSVASQQLRNDFIRMTTQASEEDNNDAVGAPHQYDYSHYNQNGYVVIHDNTQGQSLAKASTTPEFLATYLPVACIVAHLLFLYGQLAPMWRLSLTAEEVHLSAKPKSSTGASTLLFKALNLPDPYLYPASGDKLDTDYSVKSFTYGNAVKELWEAKGIGSAWLAKIAAFGLVVFSGFWPHVKLVLLQRAWVKPTTRYNYRTKLLGWLALLGKWSLADVLSVCVMVGVLNLEWVLDPDAIRDGVAANLHTLLELASNLWTVSQMCTRFLHFDASDCNKAEDKLKCFACKKFVHAAFNNPDVAETTGESILKDLALEGGGAIRLSVKGMSGIYYFCAAVIISVLLSVTVEWYNHLYLDTLRKERASNESHTLSLTEEEAGAATSTISALSSSQQDVENDAASEPLLLEDAPPQYEPMEIMTEANSVFDGVVTRTAQSRSFQWFQCHYVVPTVSLVFVGLAVYQPSMRRHVGGGIPDLLKDILGVNLDKEYSLATLKDTTGAAGGWDLLLMATFGLFCVVGPLLRAILVVMVAMSKPTEENQRIRSLLVRASNFLASFCAWEVFLAAMIMVELIMPQATATIMNSPLCPILAKDGGSCLAVAYERDHKTFACLVLGFVLIGALSIHVSLEDQKIQHNGLPPAEEARAPPTEESQSQQTGGPPLEIDTTPSYELASTEAPMEELREVNHSSNDGPPVATMIQEEVV